ncbi:LacI family DNA-binding transcriptional regulator [Jiangella gansuensis]|uniref:LacI family DNA-binding transcriptional regulator n=1 Tax=Jiangella gansuensis TaxID=281473 RepID=UPI00047D7A87|nr:LacI family DNA-binding transcriptional regulator [Jiangella gansuensis]
MAGDRPKRVTIYSIARECGVSASTVSRAFTRPEIVNDDVREKIHAVARRLGYQPNKAARGLATGRAGMIGLLVPDITNPFFPPLVRSIQQAASVADWSVLLVDADEVAAEETELVEQVRSQVDGLIVASPRSTDADLETTLGDIPTVVINRVVPGRPSVVCDNTTALTAAGQHLRELGHRRFALLKGPEASWAARQRSEAIRQWAADAEVDLVESGDFAASYDGGREASRAFLDSDATAAFAFDDLMACGVLAGLVEAGSSVPDDRSLVGCDDVLLARTVTPSLTTVTAPVGALGAAAIDLLREAIGGEPARELRLDGTLTLRASTGTVPVGAVRA